jgi:transcriptional regulator with XRE-family HTH domain
MTTPSRDTSTRRLLGEAVRRRRLALGLSQEELAAHGGLHRTYLGGVERGERNPSLDSVGRLAAALGVEPWQLLAPDR